MEKHDTDDDAEMINTKSHQKDIITCKILHPAAFAGDLYVCVRDIKMRHAHE